MTTYQYATGSNNTAGYAAFDTLLGFDPRCTGLTAGRRLTAGDGLVYEDGSLTADLEFGFLNQTQYTALMNALGLSSAASAAITISLPLNNTRVFDDFNAVVIRPDMPADARFERGKYIDVTLRLVRIIAI